MKKRLLIVLGASLVALSIFGCSDDDSSSSSSTTGASGVIVDPYIVGATLCEDLNQDGVCSADEQVSSLSSADGVFSFEQNLSAGSHIIIKTQGLHEGVEYDLNISCVVDANGSIEVVSPLTTFETKGLTTQQIAEILNHAAEGANLSTWSISAEDILSNPLDGDIANKTIDTLSDSDLINIQASLASYGILKIMSGSDALSELNATELYASGMELYGHDELYQITKAMLENLTATLNTTTLSSIDSGIQTGRNMIVASSGGYIDDTMAEKGLPTPTAGLVISVAVSIIDRLAEIGYSTCNSSGGDVSAALGSVAEAAPSITSKAIDLGEQLYGMTYQEQMESTFSGMYSAALDGIYAAQPNIETGATAKKDGYVTIRFDESNNLIAQ